VSNTLLLPILHGALGAADELILLCLPFVVGIILFDLLVERARRRHREERTRSGKRDE
jgi:hypothetical protein